MSVEERMEEMRVSNLQGSMLRECFKAHHRNNQEMNMAQLLKVEWCFKKYLHGRQLVKDSLVG